MIQLVLGLSLVLTAGVVDGQGSAASDSLTTIDLADDWAPRIFSETPDRPQTYRATFVAMANERIGEGRSWVPVTRRSRTPLCACSPIPVDVLPGRTVRSKPAPMNPPTPRPAPTPPSLTPQT